MPTYWLLKLYLHTLEIMHAAPQQIFGIVAGTTFKTALGLWFASPKETVCASLLKEMEVEGFSQACISNVTDAKNIFNVQNWKNHSNAHLGASLFPWSSTEVS